MRRAHLLALGLLAAVLLVWGAAMAVAVNAARLPDGASGKVLAVFGPSASSEATLAAIVAAGARPVRPLAAFLWVAQSDEPGLAGRLRAQGALAVFGDFAFGPSLSGCIAYVRADKRPPNLLR